MRQLAHRPLASSEHGGQHRQDLHRPAMDCGVIDEHASLAHHLFDVPQAQRVVQSPELLAQRSVHRQLP